MAEDKKFEEWLRRAAETPEVEELLARSDAQPPLPEEVLAEYYAGTLSEEDADLVARRAAASAESSAFLAQLDSDVEAAAAEVAPPQHAFADLRGRLGQWAGRILLPAPGWRLAASVAAVALLMLAGSRLLDRPPSEFGLPHDPSRLARGPGGQRTVELPGQVMIDRVDPEWPLRVPRPSPRRVRWFAWDPILGASSYGVELRDASGQLVFARAGLGRNVFRLPWSTRRKLERGVEYSWVVTALDADSKPLARAVGRFKLE